MSEQEPSALRECPYCGERAIMTTLHTNNGRADNPLAYAYVVRCFVCEAQRLPAATPQIAVKEWNRRDGEAARVAEAVAAERARILERIEGQRGSWDRAAACGDSSPDYAEGAELALMRIADIVRAEDAP
jgi:hypothetical protein